MNCSPISVRFAFKAVLLNIQDAKVNHLNAGDIPLPTIYTVYALGVWPLLTLLWVINWYRYRKSTLPLHLILASQSIISMTYSLFNGFFFNIISRTGEVTNVMQISRASLMFLCSMSYYIFRMLASKGWGIIRIQLASQEKRIIFGNSA
ncbi:hypothetical protein K493DRAFT_81288 [Basidiobolus meristosporus CBS 931.73]|uniref:Uncharacterized protein n=1 Tax=Basidiobolus meristosporus CBS 931.73 TaxID=1314790 RepID=A0A1Y1XPA4_9FUNG|nr:hypothetical protein K493DRAFT_81288 [Basidiobolus meristosporus CBS 931.73]|eukprot:ORX87346.1 hypothetical protein K493DRAFT_81288 [Basidiobolus meristosporus CBS 931.73]